MFIYNDTISHAWLWEYDAVWSQMPWPLVSSPQPWSALAANNQVLYEEN